MGIAEEMRNVTLEIINSFDARVERVKALRQETLAMLKGFQRTHCRGRGVISRRATLPV